MDSSSSDFGLELDRLSHSGGRIGQGSCRIDLGEPAV
jgi:hypothetical protein